MDVQMPDGTIIRGVPEGTTRSQLASRASKAGIGIKAPDRAGFAGTLDAGARGFTDMASFGLADKVVAGLNSVIPLDKATNPNIQSVWETGDIGKAFRNNLNQEQVIAAKDQQQHGFARGVGQVLGAVAGPVPGRGILAAGAKKAATTAVRAGAASTKARLGAGALRIAGEGAIQSGLHGMGSGDSTSVMDRLSQGGLEAVQGGTGSLLGAGLVRGGTRAMSPLVDPAVAKLAKMGVTMTPGQRAGPGLLQWMENAAESVPGLGVPIRAAKRRGVAQYMKGTINEALKPIGAALPNKTQAGRAAIEAGQEAVSNSYDQALANISAPIDQPFQQGLATISSRASQLPPNEAASFNVIMQNKIAPLLKGSVLDGKSLQDVTRTLQGLAAKADNGDVAGELLADELRAVRQHFLDLAGRHSPDGTAAFQRANEAYANLSRIEGAAAKAHGEGIPTPHQLSVATAKNGYGTTTKRAAAGQARMQDVTDAGKKILPSTLPNSGTAERAAFQLGLGAIGGGSAAINPGLAALALPAAPYVPGVDALLQKFALRGQGKTTKGLAEEIRKRAYVGGMLGAPMALQVGD